MTGWPDGPVPPLARSTLDRAAQRRTDPAWLADAWKRARVLVVDVAAGGRALVEGAATAPVLVLLDADAAPEVDPAGRLFLGVEPDGTPVFAVDVLLPVRAGARAVTLRDVGHLLGDRDAGVFTSAAALANWHAAQPFSPASGQPTSVAGAGWSRIEGEGRQLWPRTDPAMIVAVHDGVSGPAGRCLLGNNATWPDREGELRFSCLAGYVEPGESAEAAVLREVDEEVGVTLDRIEYAGSQAWPFPGSLMLGFLATADPGQPLRVDPTEIAVARWFTRREIAAVLAGERVDAGDGRSVTLPMESSIAFFLISRWLEG
ncbi:NAD(+) diphosphatase [Polymorphospora rubra]|uniref:NAD(+) diphosphatase n=1 Tax=Polymorphospora rubra TaxID=338584 RepID=UPI0033C57B81